MKRTTRIFPALLLTALLLTSCGGGGSSGSSASYDMAVSQNTSNGWSGGKESVEAPAEWEMAETVEDASDAPAAEPMAPREDGADGELQPEKIIYTAQLNLETTEFSQAAADLERLTEEMGGFVESGSVGDRGSGYSWGDYTIRIPAERFNAFLDRAGQLCHETWRSVERQNISESYYDTAGRLKTQQIKLERLQALLAKAEEMADIITIESAIAETEWNIDSLSGELRHYDAQVDYSTIYVSLQEVYRLSNVEEVPVSFTGRLASAFTDGLRAFGEQMEDLAVSLAYGWLWLLILAAVVFLLVRLLRKKAIRPFRRKKRPQQSGGGEENGDDKSEEP